MLRVQRLSLDICVLFLLLFWALIGPSLFDDGWFIQTAQHSLEYRNFYNIYNIYDGRFPLGWIWLFLNSAWATVSDNLFWNRLPSVLYLFLSWKLTFKTLVLLFPINLRHAILGSLIFLTGCFGFLLSVRPESFIFLCLTLIVFLLISIDSNNIENRLVFVSIVAGVSASTHLSGAIALFPIVFWLKLKLKQFKTDQTWNKLFAFGFSLMCAFGSAFVLNLFLFSNLRDFVSTTELWSNASESSDQSIFVNLFSRFFEVFNENAADSHFRRSSAMLIILAFLFFNRGKTELKSLSWMYWSLVSALAYLLFLPSASPWQLGPLIIFPIFLILGTLISAEKSFGYLFVFFFIFFLSIFNWIVWLSPNKDLFEFVDYMTFPLILQSLAQSITFWLLFFSFCLVLFHLYIVVLRKKQMSVFLRNFSSVLLVFSFGLPILVDIVEHLPSFRNGNSRSFFDLSTVLSRDEPICSNDGIYTFPDLLNGVVHEYDSGELNTFSDSLTFNGSDIAVTSLVPSDLGGFLSLDSPFEFDYLLIFAKNVDRTPFVLTLSNGAKSIGESFLGANPKKIHEYTPYLFRLSDLISSDGSTGLIVIKTTEDGVIVSSPILINGENARYFSGNPNLNFQVSSELQPYFSCLSEEFFANGLSIKPHYTIGQLPVFPRSPANVFFDYEDYVLFPIDSVRNIGGYALIED